ncbi:MAG: FYDLN acid domain-containing protein [Solobacterium sp.]|nr:FYDLN acid domain-containing protein [Solobacterium sp.]
MYYVEDGTKRCGLYTCKECGMRFLDVKIAPRISCPYCGEEAFDMEIGPDDEMPEPTENAILEEVIEGEENVERYDALLSLAITGGNYDWI